MSASAVVKGAVLDWQAGWRLYMAGKSASECTSDLQVSGWWAALDADCAADTCQWMGRNGASGAQMDAFLDDISHREPAVEDDYNWIRTGC